MDIHDNRATQKASSEWGKIVELRIEIRKHHVTPGVNVLELVMDVDGEKMNVTTQHQDDDPAFQKFGREALKLAQDLSKEMTFLGIPVKR